jgi:hypothetical protein
MCFPQVRTGSRIFEGLVFLVIVQNGKFAVWGLGHLCIAFQAYNLSFLKLTNDTASGLIQHVYRRKHRDFRISCRPVLKDDLILRRPQGNSVNARNSRGLYIWQPDITNYEIRYLLQKQEKGQAEKTGQRDNAKFAKIGNQCTKRKDIAE